MELEEYSVQKLVIGKTIHVEVPAEWIGQEVEVTITPSYLVTAKHIVRALQQMLKDLWWTSETDASWEVRYLGQMGIEVGLEKWVIEKLDLPQPIEGTTIDFFFKHMVEKSDTLATDASETAQQYRKVYEFLRTAFQKTLVLRSGAIEKTILVVGRTKQLSVVVLQTSAVET